MPDRGRSPERTRVWHVYLNWQQRFGPYGQRIVLNALSGSTVNRIRHHDSVIWQHSDHDNNSLKELESLVVRLKSFGLNDNDLGLTKRLLKRVQSVSERAFVAGSFLTPTALRYIMLDDSRYGVDTRCVFLAFPYFEVKKTAKKMIFGKGDPRHPTRTLLQSRYRLNETTDRDKSQCIRMLDGRALQSYVKVAQPANSTGVTEKIEDELIYVPQMWALIVDQDHLITSASMTHQALQGPKFELEDHQKPDNNNRCSLVRISFINRGIQENVTFPMAHCTSWFGLLNMHQQIRNSLGHGKDETKPKDYPLSIGQHELSGKTWADVQRSADGQTLELWMDTPKPPKVKVTTTDDGSGSEAYTAGGAEEESQGKAEHQPCPTSDAFRELDHVPVVRPFLAWRVVDDFGETHECPVDIQIGRFLNTIYSWLPAQCAPQASTSATAGGHAHLVKDRPRPEMMVVGRSCQDADSLSSKRSEQNFYRESSILLAYFVPKSYDKESPPIRLYWGLVYKLIVGHSSVLW